MNWKHMKGIVTIASAAIGFSSMSLMAWMGWSSVTIMKNSENISGLTASVNDIPEMKTELTRQGNDVAALKYYFDNGVLKRLQLENLKRETNATTT